MMWNVSIFMLFGGGCLMSDVEHLILKSVSHPEDSAVVEYIVQDSAEEVIELDPPTEEFVIQGMRFIHISAGSFQMGSPAGENGRQPHPNDSAEVAIEWEKAFQVTLTNDYFLSEAQTTYGKLGVKVWICRGEKYGKQDLYRELDKFNSK